MIILGMFQPRGQQGGYKDARKCCDQCAVELQLCHLQIVTLIMMYLSCDKFFMTACYLGLDLIAFSLVAVQMRAD